MNYKKQYRHWLTKLRRGTVVGVCYDGKWGRAVKGTVVSADKRRTVVSFLPWPSGEKPVTVRFIEGGGWAPPELMGSMFGLRGDWYRIVPVNGEHGSQGTACLEMSDLDRESETKALCAKLSNTVNGREPT